MQKPHIVLVAALIAATASLHTGCRGPRPRFTEAIPEPARETRVVRPVDARVRSTTEVLAGDIISYQKLGWHAPEAGEAALRRFHETMGNSMPLRILTGLIHRAETSTIIPDSSLIYVLNAGERFSGVRDDLSIGRVKVTPLGGSRGTIRFDPLDERTFVRVGSGIALPVGSRLELEDANWNGLHFDAGILELRSEGAYWEPKSQ